MRSRRTWLAAALAVALVGGIARTVVIKASDHRDSTLLTNNPGVDINDTYLFLSPTDPDRVVLVMTVDGFIPPAENGTHFFEPNALYQFKIDTNGDATEDLVIQALAVGTGPNQRLVIKGPATPVVTGATSRLLRGEATITVPISPRGDPRIVTKNGVNAFAGLRDDPFFFDLTRFREIIHGQATSFRNPGVDTFAGFNTLAIVLELPKSMLGSNPNISLWGTTSRLAGL